MFDRRPLGVFDSGLGGLTVVRALLGALPDESIVYLGDTARVPYGTRSAETVVRYARGCARVLRERDVKALIVACNTVSAVALDMLRAEFDLPVVGVVDPGARAAVRAAEALILAGRSKPAKIGVLGTAGTIASGAYPRAVARLTTRLEVVAEPAPLLVPLVEEGWLEGQVPELAVERYVAPLIENGASVLVLGCTHYPLLQPIVARVARRLSGADVPVVDSAFATAEAVQQLFAEQRVLRAPERGSSTLAHRLELLVTDLPASFSTTARRFLGAEIAPEVAQIDLLPDASG
jgi:glutamate racemase